MHVSLNAYVYVYIYDIVLYVYICMVKVTACPYPHLARKEPHSPLEPLILGLCPRKYARSQRFYLTECIHELVLESQLPPQIRELDISISNSKQ